MAVNLVEGGALAASSLRGSERAAFAASLERLSLRGDGSVSNELEEIGGQRYLTVAFPLLRDRSGEPLGRLVLLQDWQPTQQFLDTLQRRLVSAGVVILGCALAGALVFSRRMTRPLKEMATAAGEIAGGNWTRQVPLRGSAEATSWRRLSTR